MGINLITLMSFCFLISCHEVPEVTVNSPPVKVFVDVPEEEGEVMDKEKNIFDDPKSVIVAENDYEEEIDEDPIEFDEPMDEDNYSDDFDEMEEWLHDDDNSELP